jgi:hypothetical protein
MVLADGRRSPDIVDFAGADDCSEPVAELMAEPAILFLQFLEGDGFR